MKLKKLLPVVLIAVLFALFALGSGESEPTTVDQGDGAADVSAEDKTTLGDYSVEISDCKVVKDFEGKPAVIITYKYTNNSSDTPTSFFIAFDDAAYQDGVGLNESFFLDDGVEYDSESKNKEIKKGTTIDVQVAYKLNDSETPVEIEISELFSFEEKTITKTFDIKEK